MKYDVYTNIWNIFLVSNRMSGSITWVFGLPTCTGLYGIHNIFGHDKDYSDTSRIKANVPY